MVGTVSFMDANKKKIAKSKQKEVDKEIRDKLEKQLKDFKKFKDLEESELYKECVDFIKDEIYKGLSFTPGDGGDWWLKYSWGLKCFIERVKGHANSYDNALVELSK